MERRVTVTYRYASNLTILYMNKGFTVEHIVIQCVEQYSHRKPTVYCDKLDTFVGVLEYFFKDTEANSLYS